MSENEDPYYKELMRPKSQKELDLVEKASTWKMAFWLLLAVGIVIIVWMMKGSPD